MSKTNLTYFLYGAIVFTALAWISVGVLPLLVLMDMADNNLILSLLVLLPLPLVLMAAHRIVAPNYLNMILLVLLPLPWVALIGFSWFSHALERRGQSDAAWSIIFLSLTLWVLYVVVMGKLLLPT